MSTCGWDGPTVVVHGDQGPVGDDTSNAHSIGVLLGGSRAGDQVLDGGSVEELDVGELEHLAQESGCKQRSVLDGDPVTIVLVRDAQLVEEELSRLAHDHGAEELATEPRATTRSDASFDDGDLEVRTLGCEHESSGETTRSGTNNDNVRLGVGVEVLEVASGFTSSVGCATLLWMEDILIALETWLSRMGANVKLSQSFSKSATVFAWPSWPTEATLTARFFLRSTPLPRTAGAGDSKMAAGGDILSKIVDHGSKSATG